MKVMKFSNFCFEVIPQKEVERYLLGKQKQPAGKGIPFEFAIWCQYPVVEAANFLNLCISQISQWQWNS